VKVSHRFDRDSAVFDDGNLVSCAGLVPVMTLAEQTGLARLLADKVRISAPRIKSGAANPAPKLATVVAGMCAGADCIDDIDLVRSGGMKTLFGGVYAPSTVGTLLREFTFGHARQLESVLREHLVALCERVELLPGADQQVFIDVDSLLRPVYGHAKQGASYGHTKIAGKQVLRKGLSPLATTISTANAAPVIAGMRLRAGKTGSAKGAGRMVAQAISTARAAGAGGAILVRGDSAYGNRAVIAACRSSKSRHARAAGESWRTGWASAGPGPSSRASAGPGPSQRTKWTASRQPRSQRPRWPVSGAGRRRLSGAMAWCAMGRRTPAVGLGFPASASVGWTTPSGVGAAATAIRLLGIHGDAVMGSRFQPVGLLALRGLDPAVTANHNTVALLSSPASRPSSVDP
jgi:hypothetical protein